MTGDFPLEPTVEDTWDALRRRAELARARSAWLQQTHRAILRESRARRDDDHQVEEAIARAARAGDPGAREALMRRYAPIISALARQGSDGSPARRAHLVSAGRSAVLLALADWDPAAALPFRVRALEQARAAIKAHDRRRRVM
jgi:DNA-directed RNA polymerase specialized sigma subunit